MSGAFPEPTRAAALGRLATFADDAGKRYAQSRNFDFGPDRRGNVSTLSPYVRHRLVLEQELIGTALARHGATAAGKFVEEVFWRGYFKGWLEHRPQVWDHYRQSVSRLVRRLEADDGLLGRYSAATEGKTGIECFDAWVAELLSTGYLHNHARMWFASIWVYTLDLPWQLGADFFYRHLIDGDPASNTLGWRWVCGLHTPGKTYLARASNIASFTNDRYNPRGQLATTAPPLVESSDYPLQPLPVGQSLPTGERFGLLVTEEDGCPETLLDGRVPVTVLGVVTTKTRSPLPVGPRVCEFASGAVADAVARTARSSGIGVELSGSGDWPDLIVEWARRHELEAVVTAYAPVGPVAEQLAHVTERLARREIGLLQLRRPYDSATWQHAQRGYFRLKQKIPAILDELAIAQSRSSRQH